ncbi:MAG: chromate efflux transporter [Nitrospirae bacterium]|nr:MAG: chromate efflux transporter [Nitrospirota bacterium]
MGAPRGARAGEVFACFLRLGLTAFGGPAMVAYIREQVVARRRWVAEADFEAGVALCQTLPGATAMQAAAYAGLRAAGPRGALAAYAGFGLPALLLMVALAAAYERAHALPAVAAAFTGLKAVVCAIVGRATVTFGRKVVRDPRDLALAAAAALFLAAGGPPAVAIGVAALLSLLRFRDLGAAAAPAAAPVAGAGRAALGLALGLALLLAALAALRPQLFRLAALMVRVDLLAFGGGYASLPLLLHQVVAVRGWLDAPTFMDGIALGQVTPGPIVITATFVGQLVAGLGGALAATAGMFTPSLVVLLAAVPHLDRLGASPGVRRALRGVLATFVGLLAAVLLRFLQATPWSPVTAAVAAAAFAALLAGIDLLWVVAAGAAAAAWLGP